MLTKEKIEKILIKYNAALKTLETQIEIINNDYKYLKKYNPIEHIKTRLKTPKSIIEKLHKNNYQITEKNIIKYINDIAGIRIICSFLNDVYELIEIIRKTPNIKIIKEKDYIKNPKKSGYRSYHMIVEIPIYFINEEIIMKAEIQIRTMAMDLWASLDHKLSYKSSYCTSSISKRLIFMSNELNIVDLEMNNLINIEKLYNKNIT